MFHTNLKRNTRANKDGSHLHNPSTLPTRPRIWRNTFWAGILLLISSVLWSTSSRHLVLDVTFVLPFHEQNSSLNVPSNFEAYENAMTPLRHAFGLHVDFDFPDQHLRTDLTSSLPLQIAQYSNVYGPNNIFSDDKSFESCSRSCMALGDYGDVLAASKADVVLINLQDFSDTHIPWTRSRHQLWVGVYFESPAHYPPTRNAQNLRQFNYTMGYRPDADFPVLSMIDDTFKDFEEVINYPLPTWDVKRVHAEHMSVWISNCHMETSGRTKLWAELQVHGITVASYGRCQNTHNTSLPEDMNVVWQDFASRGDGRLLVALASRHLFFFAAENSNCAYYITEKVFHGLVAGSIPIYLGDAERLKLIAPPDSVIYASDFQDAAALATYLKALIEDRREYEKYLVWRADKQAIRKLETIMSASRYADKNIACAFCDFLHSRGRRKSSDLSSSSSIPGDDLCVA